MKYIPSINLQYWAFLLCLTILGETAGDLLSQSMNLGYGMATFVLFCCFLISVLSSVLFKIQSNFLYWIIITLAGTLGTTISDYLARTMNLGYNATTGLLMTLLIVIFYVWHNQSSSKSVFDQFNIKSNFLYWFAILLSSTLGTALGDLLAHNTPLGFGGSSIFLFVLLLLVIFLTLFTKISREICYWLAIVIIHPIGATMGDFMTKEEGLNLGNFIASGILLIACFFILISGKWLRRVY